MDARGEDDRSARRLAVARYASEGAPLRLAVARYACEGARLWLAVACYEGDAARLRLAVEKKGVRYDSNQRQLKTYLSVPTT